MKNIADNRHLIIISPETPPQVCGVGDYSYQLAQQLLSSDYYKSLEIAVEKNQDKTIQKQIPVKHWRKALSNVQSNAQYDLLINFTPLGFSKIAYPIAFISALKSFKEKNSGNRVFVLFHEVWNGNPKLRIHHKIRDYFSKKTCVAIGKIASGISVVTYHQKEKLEKELPEKTILLQPVGANIYPPGNISPLLVERSRGIWVIFGLSHTRLWTLKANIGIIKKLLADGGLTEIMSIGPYADSYGAEEAAFAIEHLGVNVLKQLGKLPAELISRELLNASGAFVGQTADSLVKSGTFLSMAAHAVPVVCNVPEIISNPPGEALFQPDELVANPNIIFEEAKKRTEIMLDWYKQTRSWEAIAHSVVKWMQGPQG